MLYLGWLGGGLVGACVGWCCGQMIVSKIFFAYIRRSMDRES